MCTAYRVSKHVVLSAEEVHEERLSQHHLTTAYHTSPAAVARVLSVCDRMEALPVRQPNTRGKVLPKANQRQLQLSLRVGSTVVTSTTETTTEIL